VTRRAIKLLDSKRNDAYQAALAALREDTQAWWADLLARGPDELDEGEEPAAGQTKRGGNPVLSQWAGFGCAIEVFLFARQLRNFGAQ
jgi:hypothetical protein